METFVAKTLYGLENVLSMELRELGASDVRPANRAVYFAGNKELMYRVNYCARTAVSVLLPVATFSIGSKDDLYYGASRVRWSEFLDPGMTFSIVPVVNSKLFGHTAFPALVLKDAIADYFRKKTGKRPDVDTHNPDILINLHISNSKVTVSLDSSASPLFQRGYRVEQGKAPMNEVLAAGILMLAEWNASVDLIDPMCGSGTLITEAGLIAKKIPPGFFRSSFGFKKWKDFDEDIFIKVKDESDNKITPSSIHIYGSDISKTAVRIAAANLKSAGLSDIVSLNVADFKDVRPPGNQGCLVSNPPYGKRLSPPEIHSLYNMIGSTLKHNFTNYKAWIITYGKEFINDIGLKPCAKFVLFNGSLQCILAGFELYEGTKKNLSDRRS
ncbi:MAG TPA: THUMP domain-containing protein [Bacteroidales bacterium]|nr:THUMP domain-containing protein [Bacteroidales bacterium]